MLFAGDIVLNKQVPVLMESADPDGYMAAFDLLTKQFDIQKIVPGHGAIGGLEVMNNFRQYFIDMKTAASDDSKKDELIAKYKDWVQLPFFMSPDATINFMRKKMRP
jgi:glyoxylase-like metal-dependent hydrolase (beta-lactamase superfamily II)